MEQYLINLLCAGFIISNEKQACQKAAEATSVQWQFRPIAKDADRYAQKMVQAHISDTSLALTSVIYTLEIRKGAVVSYRLNKQTSMSVSYFENNNRTATVSFGFSF